MHKLLAHLGLCRQSSICPSSTLFKHLLIRNHWAYWSQISYGVSMEWGNESLFKLSWSHDQSWLPSPYVVKTLKIFFSGTKGPMTLKLGMQHWVLKYYQVCSNDDTGLTLTYFTARLNLIWYAFVWEKGITMDFSETIVVFDLKQATDDCVKWQEVSVDIKTLSPGGCMSPAPGLYTCI